jgi:hypothetical protein
MNDIIASIHRFIFERTLNLFDWWSMSLVAFLATEYSVWCWLLIIPCIYVSISESRKL